MVDPLRFRALLDRLGTEIVALRRLSRRDAAELLADEDVLAAIKYRFVVAIEACIAAGRHLVAAGGLRTPRDYADVFTVLGEAGMLPARLVSDLREIARFRNLLVHGYAAVEDDRVVQILHTRLDDLEKVRAALAAAAGRGGPEPAR
ncbi:DUF86 domain-containing protein [Pseudonocardia nematodicida]|uniref:DUF86 domain-containing protein n=1 Tax=Pseudonocardia nematodicida TaxID=1206997 RepID=A0ABV1KF51_9PSEU